MQLTIVRAYELVTSHGVFARDSCDKCGRLLGAVRFTRRCEAGEWCSRECRGDSQRVKVHKGGRPRRYRSNADRQRAYRGRSLGVGEQTPLQIGQVGARTPGVCSLSELTVRNAPGLKDADVRYVGYGNLSGPDAQSVMIVTDIAVYGALFALLSLVFVFYRSLSNHFRQRGHPE
jgi:hypothetical protein